MREAYTDTWRKQECCLQNIGVWEQKLIPRKRKKIKIKIIKVDSKPGIKSGIVYIVAKVMSSNDSGYIIYIQILMSQM